ncbi:peptidoglycan hydrolase-like protein with peptidoglycan-binding domain [Luteibacter sp. 621]|uniref:XVIPCD domain-containing protein n=1 Tax=Luteibacter sp. 621 TaxID=3373916 RepID=UPI003D20764D
MTDQDDLYGQLIQPKGPAYRDSQVDQRYSQSRFESGFNPDAAAGPTSAYGVGQFVKNTGHAYGIPDEQRGDLTRQAEALVAYYQDNSSRATRRGEGEEYIYAYHHDGAHASPEALALSRDHIMPFVPAFERFVERHEQEHGRLPPDPGFHDRTHTTQTQQQGASNVIRQGSRGQDVADLQAQLSQLGYQDSHRQDLVTDGHFGPGTRAAVEAFQRDHSLTADGVVGARTRDAVSEALTQAATPSLDQPAHADHALYLQVRNHVYRLDQAMGRNPDAHSDNLAAGLTVAARQDGLLRIDQIALSEDGSRLWGAQRPPGVRDHFYDQFTSVSTQAAMTPVAETSAQWPQAMERFEQRQVHQQAQQQVQAQEPIQLTQSPSLTR